MTAGHGEESAHAHLDLPGARDVHDGQLASVGEPSTSVAQGGPELTIASAYAGKRVLVTGASGFLGGVVLSLLLDRASAVERVFVLLRKSPGLPVTERFAQRVLSGAAFDPIRDRWDYLGGRVTVLQGDLSQADLGFDDAALAQLAGLDLVLNCAGLVDFDAPLDQAHRVNIEGTRHVGELAARLGARLVHVSTCFVAGGCEAEDGAEEAPLAADGAAPLRVPEVAERGYFPRRVSAPFLEFSPEREIADLLAEVERVGAQMGEQAAQARFLEQARKRARLGGGALPGASSLANTARRIQRDETTAALVQAGRKRAAYWGWPNVYTYSKSIGEQILLGLVAESQLDLAIVRPAIIESALNYPEPGYNLNATTSAPLVGLALAGFRLAPANPELALDIVPVDVVASGILAVGAALLAGRAKRVYQIGTSDSNPCKMERITELIGLYLHEERLDKAGGSKLGRWLDANREPGIVSREVFERRTKLVGAGLDLASRKARELASGTSSGRLREALERAADRAESATGELRKAAGLWEFFLPFSHDHDYRFATGHIRALWAELGEPVDPAALDWRRYWIDVHIPGLRRHVLASPAGKAEGGSSDGAAGKGSAAKGQAARGGKEGRSPARVVVSRASLLERLEDVVRSDGHRAAVTWCEGERLVSWTYAQLWERAGAVTGTKAVTETGDGTVTGTATESGLGPDAQESWLLPLVAGLRAGGEVELPGLFSGSARQLAERLAALGEDLDLRERAPLVVSCEAAGAQMACLAVLYAKGELWLVPPDLLDAALEASAAEAAVIGPTPPEAPHRLRRVLDLAPLAGDRRLTPLREGQVEIRREESSLAADAAIPEGRPGTGMLRLEVSEGNGTAAALRSRLLDVVGIADAAIVQASRIALVRPDLAHWGDFRKLRERLEKLLAQVNADLAHGDRLVAMVVGLAPDLTQVDWESRSDWIRLSARDTAQPDWNTLPDDRIPLADLEEETHRLARGRLVASDLEFVWDCYRDGPVTFEGLLALERVLIRAFRRLDAEAALGRPARFNAQAFAQDHASELARLRSVDYRAARQVGMWLQKWRNWREQPDPQTPLLPEAVTRPIQQGLGEAAKAFFDKVMDVDVRGQAYLPAQGTFVVVANHSSHLDTGVVKFALGPWGDRLRALAARDYFFKTPARRFAARHFTRLIPVDRQAVSTEWIKQAVAALAAGDCVLIFPEGTRTDTPEVKAFKASLGTLLRACQVPVLPVYIEGTHEILPKGAVLPKGRKIQVHLGPPIPWERIDAAGGPGGSLGRDRAIAAYVQEAVAALPGRRFFWLSGDLGQAAPEAEA